MKSGSLAYSTRFLALVLGGQVLVVTHAQHTTQVEITSGSQTTTLVIDHAAPGLADSDQNGLPDAWEQHYFGHLGVDPLADSDSDGLENILELQYGKNPDSADNESAPENPEVEPQEYPTGTASYLVTDLGPGFRIDRLANNGWVAGFGSEGFTLLHHGQIVPFPVDTEELIDVNGAGKALIRRSSVPSTQIWNTQTGDLTTLQSGMIDDAAGGSAMSLNYVVGSTTWSRVYYEWSYEYLFIGDDHDGALWRIDGKLSRKLGKAFVGQVYNEDFDADLPFSGGVMFNAYFVNDHGDFVGSFEGADYPSLNGTRTLDFYPAGLNNDKMMIGEKADEAFAAGWWAGNTWHRLSDTPMIAAALNNRGDILAFEVDALFGIPLGLHLYLRTGTGPGDFRKISIDDSLPSGWSLDPFTSYVIGVSHAAKLNDDGSIALYAFYQPTDSEGQPVGDAESRTILLTPLGAELAVDSNRDGQIRLSSEEATDVTTVGTPFRFWVNDDDDSGDINGSDIPIVATTNNGPANWQGDGGTYFGMHGGRDLIDWFPVYLDIKQLLTVLPPGANAVYKLKQEDSALNFVYTGLTRATATDYQKEDKGLIFGPTLTQKAGQAEKCWMVASGVDIFGGSTGSAAFLDAIKNHDGGVILVEGRKATTKPLVLVVEKDGVPTAEVKLELKISQVETMFRHLNLRDGANAAPGLLGDQRDTGPVTRSGDPGDALPDASTDQPWFIFVVGSNVGGQPARGWESEAFKRLYWSQSKARFLGVSWFGDPYANGSDGVYDYYLAVRNAFATAPALASAVNSLPGTGAKTIAGHSLACGLISAAISDHGMNVAHAALIDAALAREVFDGRAGSGTQLSVEESGMTPAIWRDYDPRLQSPGWHERFVGVFGDNRQNLTWRNRFIGAVPKIHNFYSSTEDVLGSYEGEVPSTSLGAAAVVVMNGAAFTAYVWVYQEKAKGNRQDYYLPFLGSFHTGGTYMGWGMNLKDPVLSGDPPHWKWINSFDYIGRKIKTSAEIGNVSDSVLRRHPVFEPGWGVVKNQEQQENPVSNVSPENYAPSWIYDLYGATSGSTLAGPKTSANHAQLLAEAIPAQSWPVGSHQLNTSTLPISKQHNLPAEYAGTGWPRPTVNGVREWRHSDMREVAYLYQSRFWDALVSVSQQP